jgi:hypothetical protein
MAEITSAPASHWLNDQRVRVYSAVFFGIFIAAYLGLIALSLPGFVDPRGKPVGYDFIAFWSAAWLALQGQPEAAFDWHAIAAAHQAAVPALHDPFYLFLWHYPPTFLLAVLPLGYLPYLVALAVFLAGSIAAWAALVRRIIPDRRAERAADRRARRVRLAVARPPAAPRRDADRPDGDQAASGDPVPDRFGRLRPMARFRRRRGDRDAVQPRQRRCVRLGDARGVHPRHAERR